MKSRLLSALSACLICVISVSANAALVSKPGGQVVYDTDRDITWLADANLASSNTFGVAGINVAGGMSWDTANTWITAMNTDGEAGYLGFSDWRLPITLVPDPSCSDPPNALSLNCTGSELGHLFYDELGGTANQSILDSSDPDLALFTNIGIDAHYWSGTPYTPLLDHYYAFFFERGEQSALTAGPDYVWAVADGDVFVPIPPALYLFGSGLLGLIGIARKTRNMP